ncbi:MAG: DUF3035 domain-containing protein [Proteobacteria bacterium]|nr:DUF3035 domain-containing protein [Pseudomonadota bacterium]
MIRIQRPKSVVFRLSAAAGMVVLALVLGGCETLRGAAGLTKKAPDEFRVVSRAPLSMPSHYGLKAPRPGTVRPQATKVPDKAKQIVLDSGGAGSRKKPVINLPGADPGEIALLTKAGVDKADPKIRQLVDSESAVFAETRGGFVEKLIFWRDPAPSGKVVDARKEARRLRENAALGRPVTEGETPIIQRKKRGLLEGVF